MKAACLLTVLLAAKGLALAGRDLPWSAWAPLAYVWQDVLVVLVFGAVDALLARRPWAGWTLYGLISAYVALNAAVVHTLSSPLTGPMLHAAGGPLADSIRHHLDAPNLLRMGVVAAVAALAPVGWRRCLKDPLRLWVYPAGLLVVGLGLWAGTRVDTIGLHRNALLAFWPVLLPAGAGDPGLGAWRQSPYPGEPGEDLSRFHGAAAGRNVVMIVLESTGASHLAPWGARRDPTPHLTRLAAQAMRFERAYCVYPESIRGLFSVLCSRHPGFGIGAESYAAIDAPSLAAELAAAGHRTGLFHSGRFRYLGMEEMLRGRGFDTLEDAGAIGGNHESSFGVDEPATVERILAWIDGLAAGERFLVTYLPIAGHHPYDAPEGGPFPDTSEVGRYQNALHYGDRAVGDLLAGLRGRGLDTNTLFVVFGDHGEAFGEHEGNYGHTLFLYEENVRVPLLFAAPGLMAEPIRVGRTASLLDVAPTLLDWMGLEVPGGFQGRSLLQGPDAMALFFTDYSLGLLGLRDGRWKCIHELNSGRTKLFDLQADPAERTDVSGLHPERVRFYRERLVSWAAAQRDRLRGEIRLARAESAGKASREAREDREGQIQLGEEASQTFKAGSWRVLTSKNGGELGPGTAGRKFEIRK